MRDLILFAVALFLFAGVIEVGPKAIMLANLYLDQEIAKFSLTTSATNPFK